MQAIRFDIKGIKCDSPACDYADMEIDFDPEYFLNRPCPECGLNLFTEKDLKAMLRIFKIAKFLNFIFRPFIKKTDKERAFKIKMDGSGKTELKEITNEK